LDSVKAENRDINSAEQLNLDEKFNKVESLKRSIDSSEKIEDFEARQAFNAPVLKSNKEVYSIVGHINAVRSGKVEGIFAEAQAQGEKELRDAGVAVNPNAVYIPSEYRDFTVTGDTGNKGGKLVATEKGSIIESLFEGSLLSKLGVTRFLGLTGNLDLPKGGKVVSAWYSENAEVSATDHNIGQIELRPNRLSTRMNVSNQLLVQSSSDVESYLRNEIEKSIQKALDEKYIEFLLASADVEEISVTGATFSGGPLTYDKVQEFIEKVGQSEADMANAKFLINYDIHSSLKQLKMDSGSGRFVLQDGRIDGFEFIASNRMPNNLTKNSGTNLSAVAFGDFTTGIVAGWGAVEILVDPYTRAANGQTVMNVSSFWDLKDQYAEAKAVSKDVAK
jgi:HK97 family phage major capsid protein